MNRAATTAILLASLLLLLNGCSGKKDDLTAQPTSTPLPSQSPPAAETAAPSDISSSPTPIPTPSVESQTPAPSTKGGESATDKGGSTSGGKSNSSQTAAAPDSIMVLVNKQFALPSNYTPSDLVNPNVPFIFKGQSEKRKMRKEAAKALEDLFAGAEKDGISLLGVSAYRSHETQKALFNNYIQKDGEQKALTYSAQPGHSEHETGLAIDVTGGDGKYAAEDGFANTKESAWLSKHAAEYGFIIRYLKGKESVTGYQYEPWHIRYVGKQAAKEIASKGIALEEYMNAVPVNASGSSN